MAGPNWGLIYMPLVLLLLIICHGAGDAADQVNWAGKCTQMERKALLAVRADICRAHQWCLSSWKGEEEDDCCHWEGVGCDNRTGHVVKLDLSNLYYDPYATVDLSYPYHVPYVVGASKVNPCLLNLTSLRYLDLSGNDFGGASIPSFIGSLVNLDYLNLSHAMFAGLLPPQLALLQHLHSLDLSGNNIWFESEENLHWLSHLSHLQYLDMSDVHLDTATEWLHVMNMLPSLSVLRLSQCWLPNLPTTLPHVNFSSLSVLDLSGNYFSSTWPLWVFNISSLVSLDLSLNYYLHGPIPEGVGNMKRLEVLSLGSNPFEGAIPGSLWTLDNLKVLSLSCYYLICSSSENFGNLKNLQDLLLDYVVGQLPASLGNITSLRHLSLDGYNVSFASLDVFENLNNLQDLILSGVVGQLSASLGNITSLRRLSLDGYNVSFASSENFGNLNNLQDLRLYGVVGQLSTSLGNITSLRRLYLYGYNANSASSENFGNLNNLRDLYLSGVVGQLPASLGNITSLQRLYLDGYNVSFASSENFGNLNNLQDLDLSGVVGQLPASLGNITSLRRLYLYGYNANSASSENFGNLNNLQELELHNVVGRLPDHLGNISSLQRLVLSNVRGNGVLMEDISNLCNLTHLELADSNIEARTEVTRLIQGLAQCTGGSAMETLVLSGNGHVGYLPEQVWQLSNLKHLDLSNNSFYGSIPASFGALKSLTDLILSYNNLSGPVPITIGKLSNLTTLDISSNSLVSVLSEAHFADLSSLSFVDMSHNSLSFNISGNWIPPFQLRTFRMRSCQVGPELPKWLRTQKGLHVVDLSNNVIHDSPPDDLFNSLSPRSSLNLSHNQMRGNLPASFMSADFWMLDLSFNELEASQLHLHLGSYLYTLALSNNKISGPITIATNNSRALRQLDLSNNSINGSIPLSICQMEGLRVLDFSYNHLSGQIPDCWESNYYNLATIKLSNNRLSGPISRSIGNLLQLQSLHLSHNDLIGEIPPSLKNCIQLVTLDLGENKLSGEIPTWLGKSLSSLQFLRLRSNMFCGNIPMSLSRLQSLQVLDLANNKLSGNLQLSFHNLTAMVKKKSFERLLPSIFASSPPGINIEESLKIVPKGNELEYTTNLPLVTIIDLSNNSLSGSIPEEIASLQGLHFLILSRNHLGGTIPANIGSMLVLESLDLSCNQLSGNIPLSISTLNFLSVFNVSYNNLSGRIPSGHQLQTFSPSTYNGNPGLCGSPVQRPCPGDVTSQDPIFQASERHEDKHESYAIWLYIGIGTGFATGFWGFLGLLLLMENKRVAYFRFVDYVANELYVRVVLHFARLKTKILPWMQANHVN